MIACVGSRTPRVEAVVAKKVALLQIDAIAPRPIYALRIQISASGASAVGSWEKGPGSVFSLKSTKVRTDKPGAFRRHQLTKGSSAFSRGVTSGFLEYSRPISPARARESAAPARRCCRSRTTSSSPRGVVSA